MLTELKGKTIVVIGAHPDDIEIGCGGLLSHLSVPTRDNTVMAIVLSCSTARHKEAMDGLKLLGVPMGMATILSLPDGSITPSPEAIAAVEQTVKHANVIFTMSPWDTHQDHRAAYEISCSACRRMEATLISYHSISSTPEFRPHVFVDVASAFPRKMAALRCHKSQAGKEYMRRAWLETWHHDKQATAAGLNLVELYHIHKSFCQV